MARRGSSRRARRERPASQNSTAPAYITRKIPYYDFLGDEALERIEQQADWLLEHVGVEFRDDAHALALWKEAGAEIDGVRVRMPDGMARTLCQTIPKQFTQIARDPKHNVKIGERHTVFAPNYGSPFVRDLDEGRRYGTLNDFQNLVKLVYRAKWLHHSGGTVVEPCDVPVNKRHLDMVYAHMRYSTKPFLGSITQKDRAEESIAMTRILFGDDVVDNNCCIMGNVNANSPLMFDKVATEAIQVYCENNQGIIVAPFILGGAMGPVTTAAAVAQALAEGMAAGAYSQLVRPGAPFVLGNFLSSMSLKSGAPTFGMPEPVTSNYAIGQLARRLGVPLRCGGSLTASKLCDAQAAYESADSMHSTALGGANYVLHSAGWLEGGLTVGYEKLMLDVDRLGGLQRMLTAGLATDDNALAADAYEEVDPGNHFLGCSHTMRNYETAFYDAELSDSESFEQWSETGSKEAVQRANERVKRELNEYEAPPIDDAIDDALRDYIARTKASRDDAWY
ncbi:MAG: trimethylamine methyltransferase family protein [Pseudomonadota bacterium]